MIRVLIADDHPVVRAGLRAMLCHAVDVEVVADCASAEAAVQLAPQADVVLMDLRFGDVPEALSGAAATRRIRALPDAPAVVVVTNYDSDGDILQAVEAGASGYLLKDAPPAELLSAVRAAAIGASALAPGVAARLLDRMRAPAVALTPRELEVLGLVADGLSNTEVALRLHLSEPTVKSHLAHVFTKLEVTSRTAAVARARRDGLIP